MYNIYFELSRKKKNERKSAYRTAMTHTWQKKIFCSYKRKDR